MSVLNSREINAAYFHPQPIGVDNAIEVAVDGAVLRCFHHCPNPGDSGSGHPTLVHFHGNGEAVGHYAQGRYPELIHRVTGGMNVLMVEYRGYGGSSGQVQMQSMLADGEAVLKSLEIDPARVIVYGRSIGSLYAIELAQRCPTLAGMVIDSGIADIRKRFLEHPGVQELLALIDQDELDSEINRWFNHETKIREYQGRLVLLHTKHDGLIDVENAYRLYLWATTPEKELRVYQDGNHNSIFSINRADMLQSLGRMAGDLFPECRSSQSGQTTPANGAAVDVGCPFQSIEELESSINEPKGHL